MNHEERRELKRHAAKALKEARAFFLVVSDGCGMPTYFYDLVRLEENNPDFATDIRVLAMQRVSGDAVGVLNHFESILKQRVNEARIEAEKKRLAEGEPKSG
jgi:hypothetical protein